MEAVGGPSLLASNLLVPVLALGSYYLGIYIRKRVFPGNSSLSLRDQFLLGIPLSLAVLAAMGPLIVKTMTDFTVFATFGLIIEQGMVVNETATQKLKELGVGSD